MSAPLVWKCYVDGCGYIGPTAEFGKPGERKCPKCGSEDSFPLRRYRCKGCRKMEEQDFWYPELGLDVEPDERDSPISCEVCVEREERKFFRSSKSENLAQGEWDSAIKRIRSKPAELEAVPVQPKGPRKALPKKPGPQPFL